MIGHIPPDSYRLSPEIDTLRALNLSNKRDALILEHEMEILRPMVGRIAHVIGTSFNAFGDASYQFNGRGDHNRMFSAIGSLGAPDCFATPKVGGYVIGIRMGGYESFELEPLNDEPLEVAEACVRAAAIAAGSLYVPVISIKHFDIIK
ncbi:MAG: hypothetical protein QG649_261 [Patescibacteria group bacterium]|nr:hypothetical protein [Patescibacteria group bacterium]